MFKKADAFISTVRERISSKNEIKRTAATLINSFDEFIIIVHSNFIFSLFVLFTDFCRFTEKNSKFAALKSSKVRTFSIPHYSIFDVAI